MRREGLKNVLLRTHDAELDARGVHVVQLPYRAGVDQLLDLVDRRMKQQDMRDHEVRTAPLCDLDQFRRFLQPDGHGLFDQCREAKTEELFPDLIVRLGGSRDDIAVIAVGDRLIQIGIHRHAVFFFQLRKPRGVHVHHRAEISHLVQGADMVLAPASAADHTDFFAHNRYPSPLMPRRQTPRGFTVKSGRLLRPPQHILIQIGFGFKTGFPFNGGCAAETPPRDLRRVKLKRKRPFSSLRGS